MSVPKYRRNESHVEFVNTFNKLRKQVILILARDFGIKARHYSVNLLEDIYDIDDKDQVILEEICSKYGITSALVDKYPDWLINGWRNEIMGILNNIGISIYCANSIYISNIQEYYNRRMHWNNAIGYCFALQDKLHEVINIVRDVSLGAYEAVFELLTHEVKLLKGVRKSDNKVLKGLNDQLPYFNNGFVYNNYPMQPFIPNYALNNNSVQATQQGVVMCRLVAKPVENVTMKEMCRIVNKAA